jgi:ferredoxin
MSWREDLFETEDLSEHRLTIDYIACDGWGICAELLPDNLELDDWGYPIVTDDQIIGPSELRRARKTLRLCPALAMKLEKVRAEAMSHR